MPRPKQNPDEQTLFQAALEGLELQKRRIDEQIAFIMSRLGRRRGRPPKGEGGASGVQAGASQPSANGRRKRRPLSAAARKRIAAAQKKRWAEFRKQAESSQ